MFVLSRPVRPVQRSFPLERVVDRLLDESLSRYFGGAATGTPSRTPALDVSESADVYTLAFDVPGATREQLKVSIEGRRVSIETLLPKDETPAAAAEPTSDTPAVAVQPAASQVLYRERSAARYARTVSLPTEVDQNASSARFENGVLTLTLAKKVAAGATTLRVS